MRYLIYIAIVAGIVCGTLLPRLHVYTSAIVYIVAAGTGMRLAEVLGLTWGVVDLDAKGLLEDVDSFLQRDRTTDLRGSKSHSRRRVTSFVCLYRSAQNPSVHRTESNETERISA